MAIAILQMPNRARDWLNQALRDLEQAEEAIRYAHQIIEFVRVRMA